MNERIKELAEQAGAVDAKHITNIPGDMVLVGEEEIKKFAELIVKECANQCDLLLDHKISSEWSRGTHDCSKAIRKYFGVD